MPPQCPQYLPLCCMGGMLLVLLCMRPERHAGMRQCMWKRMPFVLRCPRACGSACRWYCANVALHYMCPILQCTTTCLVLYMCIYVFLTTMYYYACVPFCYICVSLSIHRGHADAIRTRLHAQTPGHVRNAGVRCMPRQLDTD